MENLVCKNETIGKWFSRPTLHPAKRTSRLDRIQEARKARDKKERTGKAANLSNEATSQPKRDSGVDR